MKNLIGRKSAFEFLEARRLMAFDPSAIEQEMLQLINRFRSDPVGEYSRLIASTSPIRSFETEVTTQLEFSKVDGSMLRTELSRLSPVPPVGWHEVVYNVATAQNGTMIAKQSQEHYPNLASALNAMGVPIEAGTGQNAFYNNKNIGHTPFFVHSAYVIDWAAGAADAVGGMQKDRGHRVTLMNSLYNQVGSAVTVNSNLVSTQMFAKISSAQKLAVGAIFEDKNGSGWYEAGEGIGNARIAFKNQASGETVTTNALTAGGYQVVLPAGTYTVTATGGALAHPVVIPSMTIGTSNVWQNLIYDPNAVPPDSMEPNDTLSSATDAGRRDQTLTSLSVHAGDIDCFQFIPLSTGSASFDLRFTQTNGNLDLRLLDAGGTVIASSITSNAPESIVASVTQGQTYYLQVYSSTSATNGQYSLQLNLPDAAPPSANKDIAITERNAGASQIPLINNDSDPDGSPANLIPSIVTVGNGRFSINSDKTLSYTPQSDFVGVDRATYKVTDDQGLSSTSAAIEVMVVDFAATNPWKNLRQPLDVNDDGGISPIDVLLVINAINARGTRDLPSSLATATRIFGFVDSSGDNTLSPVDVLLVINRLNQASSGGEAELSDGNSRDIALQQVAFEFEVEQRKKRR